MQMPLYVGSSAWMCFGLYANALCVGVFGTRVFHVYTFFFDGATKSTF